MKMCCCRFTAFDYGFIARFYYIRNFTESVSSGIVFLSFASSPCIVVPNVVLDEKTSIFVRKDSFYYEKIQNVGAGGPFGTDAVCRM